MRSSPKGRSPLRSESSGSVSVTWLDREAALDLARKAAKKLVAGHPEVDGVLLFGSVLRGDAVPGSDVDLLVVLSRAEKPFLDRIPGYAVDIEGMDVDVFPYTEDELARMLAEGNSLLAEALREGEWLVGGYPDGLTVASKSK